MKNTNVHVYLFGNKFFILFYFILLSKLYMNYYKKYIKYKTKYINLKTFHIEQNNNTDIDKKKDIQKGGANVQMIIEDNINNKYPNLDKEYNVFGHMHSRLNNCGCYF